MLESLDKTPVETTDVSKKSDSAKFMESLKAQTGSGKEFMDSLKAERISESEGFMDSLKSELGSEISYMSHKEVTPPTDDDRERMKKETGWPDEIINAIGSLEEYEIYKNAGLVYAEINGTPCLIRSDIDLNQKDEFGKTNKERMEKGNAPLDKDGNQ